MDVDSTGRLVRSAKSFMKIINEVYGDELGKEICDHMIENMHDGLKGDLIQGLLSGHEYIVLERIADTSFINVIKEYRQLTGAGLREAKDVIDSVRGPHGHPFSIDVSQCDEERIQAFINNVRGLGGSVTE